MRLFAALFAVFLLATPPAGATSIEEVTGKSGVKAWLVEDHKLPLIALRFAWKGGVEQDPDGKEGLAMLAMSLLTQGAGPYDAIAFQQEMADHSINISFGATRDILVGGGKFLSAEKDRAFDLLHLALTEPHFEDKDIERERARQLTGVRTQFGSPGWQARYALLGHLFANHPYSKRSLGSPATLAGLTRKDIQDFVARHLARGNLVVAVAGDISPEDLKVEMDKLFGTLPSAPRLAAVTEAQLPSKPAIILVPRDGTQTELLFALPGPKRADPDWYAADIANYILGGGGFSSRLMQEVRDKRGLTYGISTELAPMEHTGLVTGGAATDNDKTGKAWDVVLGTWREFYGEGPRPDEVKAAQDYITGALPLSLTSTDAIAGELIDMQLNNLGRDYLDRRTSLIRGVTLDEVKEAVKKWFDPAQATLSMVGHPEGVPPTETREQVRE